jgi:hypothetical protein
MLVLSYHISVYNISQLWLTWRVSIVEQELLILSEHMSSTPVFSFICMFCRSIFVLLSFFLWPLCCLSFFDLRVLMTPMFIIMYSCGLPVRMVFNMLHRHVLPVWLLFIFLMSNFHTLAHNNFFKRIRIRNNYIHFF